MQTSQDTNEKNYLKFSLALFLCLLVRLIPFRAPNIEPIMATAMPTSRAYGPLAGFSFGFLSIILYDLLTHTIGMHTFFTAGAYGLIGLAAAYYFKNKKGKTVDYVRFAIYGTLFFDATTGLTIGPIFFHQSFMGSLIGQIPFTALHLLGNITLAACLSPGIYHFLIRKRKQESLSAINILSSKMI